MPALTQMTKQVLAMCIHIPKLVHTQLHACYICARSSSDSCSNRLKAVVGQVKRKKGKTNHSKLRKVNRHNRMYDLKRAPVGRVDAIGPPSQEHPKVSQCPLFYPGKRPFQLSHPLMSHRSPIHPRGSKKPYRSSRSCTPILSWRPRCATPPSRSSRTCPSGSSPTILRRRIRNSCTTQG